VNIMVKSADWQGVIATTDQQLAAGYKQPIVYGKRAVAHAKLGDKATAISEFDTAIAGYMAAKNSDGVADIVRTVAQVLSPAEALARVNQISDPPTRGLLQAELYGRQQDWPKLAEAAESALNGPVKPTPDQKAKLLKDSADAYLIMKDWPKARRALESLVQIQPNNVDALNNLTYLITTEFHSPADAKPFSQRAYDLAQSTGDRSVIDTHGWVLTQCGGTDLPQAINILQHLVDSNQTFTVARYHLAVAYLRQGGWQRASEELATVQTQMKEMEQNHQPVPDELKTGVPKALEQVRQKSGQASRGNTQ